jgi:hypothetical protein
MFRLKARAMTLPRSLARALARPLAMSAVLPPHGPMKLRHGALALLAAAAILGPGLALAQAQTSQAAPPVGAEVRDDKGKPVGKVEKIILGADGRPKQALVRVDRVLRALPIEALQRSGEAYVAVLSRAEIAALPPAD